MLIPTVLGFITARDNYCDSDNELYILKNHNKPSNNLKEFLINSLR